MDRCVHATVIPPGTADGRIAARPAEVGSEVRAPRSGSKMHSVGSVMEAHPGREGWTSQWIHFDERRRGNQLQRCIPKPARPYSVSGSLFELHNPARTISNLLFAVRHFVSIVTNSRQHTPLEHLAYTSAGLLAEEQDWALSRRSISNRRKTDATVSSRTGGQIENHRLAGNRCLEG